MLDVQTSQTRSREYLESFDPPVDYKALDAKCHGCKYVCKHQWRFAGLTGAKTGKLYLVGPMCPVLWQFDEDNPLRRRK